MAESFGNAMAKLSVLGQDTSKMIDCSEVIPVPKSLPIENSQCVYPAGFSQGDVEQAVRYSLTDVNIVTDDQSCQCSAAPFPMLSTVPGPATSVPPV
jgi:hypothetical protein